MKQEPKKSLIISFGIPVVGGLAVLLCLVYGLMWLSSSHKKPLESRDEASVQDAQDSQGSAEAPRQFRRQAQGDSPSADATRQASSQPSSAESSAVSASSPQATAQAGAAAAQPAQAAVSGGQPPQTPPGVQPGGQQGGQGGSGQRPRVSRKDRVEKTSPEDRAKQVQFREEERAYRASH